MQRAEDKVLEEILLLFTNHYTANSALAHSSFGSPPSETIEGRLLGLYEQFPEDMQFYIPQLVVYLVYGSFEISSKLRSVLLQICKESLHFAHRLYWFVNAFCLEGAGVTPQGIAILQKFINDVIDNGIFPAEFLVAGREWIGDTVTDVGEKAANSVSCDIEQPLLEEEKLLSHDYEAKEQPPRIAHSRSADRKPSTASSTSIGSMTKYPLRFARNLSALKINSTIPSGIPSFNNSTALPFTVSIAFWNEIIQLSRDLITVPRDLRTDQLRLQLPSVVGKYLPSSVVYAPIGNVRHRYGSSLFPSDISVNCVISV
jgi:hypothetical protein